MKASAKAKPQPTTQQKVFFAQWHRSDGHSKGRFPPIMVGDIPSRVYTLFMETDRQSPPELPVLPIHGGNVYDTKFLRDWNWLGGYLRYLSPMQESCWLLLEYDE